MERFFRAELSPGRMGLPVNHLELLIFLEGKMSFHRAAVCLAMPLLLFCSLSLAQTDHQTQSAPAERVGSRDLPKNLGCPATGASGQVTVSVVVDAKGNVAEAKALSGPEALIPAALECAKTWKYDPPASSQSAKTVTVSYGAKECPAATSDRGELQWSWVLRERSGKVAANLDGDAPPAPLYPAEERKAGAAGRMVLRVSLNSDGYVKEVQVVRSLSPALDKGVMDRLRPLKFQLRPDLDSRAPMDDFYFVITFHALCNWQTVSTEDSAK
jgi:TonB family protein